MIIVDVETSGTNPHKHGIISIGAVDFLNPKNQFYAECKLADTKEIEPAALAVNGFTKEQLKDPAKKSIREILREFILWLSPIQERTICGENPSFDRDFLRVAAEKEGLDLQLGYRTIDLHTLCYAHHLQRKIIPPIKNNRTNINTDVVLVYVGLPEEPKPHHALTGAKMEAEAFSRLILGKKLLDEFSHFEIPEYLQTIKN